MESNKYHIENFERFLKEKTDEFRMYPSKRVWYSVYNNMHPGNRLPSISMSIILIGFLFLVGYLNTNVNKETITAQELRSAPAVEQLAVATNQPQAKNNSFKVTPAKLTIAYKGSSSAQLYIARSKKVPVYSKAVLINTSNPGVETVENENSLVTINNGDDLLPAKNNITPVVSQNNNLASFSMNEPVADNNAIINNDELGGNAEIIKIQQPVVLSAETNNSITGTKLPSLAANNNNAGTNKEKATIAGINNIAGAVQPDKAWIEDFAMYNKPAAKKWAGKLAVQVYITPSVVYRTLKNNATGKLLTGNINSNFNNFNAEDAVTQKPSFGVETGLSLQYGVAKRIKLKAGLQLNYTRYNTHAFETNHPVATSVTMNTNDDLITYEVFKTSIYSNTFGLSSIKLHNETYQLSIPIGADYKLASVNNLSLYAGATIQPTLVLYGRSFIISTDRRNYVQDPSLLNRFNLNAGFETYISYKTSGYTWQLGPQYRTQIFSTNTKFYSVEERLQNFGFKIGVTKQL